MSTNAIIGLVLAILVVIGGGYYFMSSGSYSMSDTERVADMDGDGMPDTDMSDTGNMEEETAGKMSDGSFSGSWNDLALRGGNYKCDINHTGSSDITGGTVYISAGNMRGDFTSNVDGAVVESHMLKLASTMYVWSSAMPQGVMMNVSAMSGTASQGTAQGSGVSADQAYDWNCSATGTNASQFQKPSGIEFMDINAMMQGGAGMPSY